MKLKSSLFLFTSYVLACILLVSIFDMNYVFNLFLIGTQFMATLGFVDKGDTMMFNGSWKELVLVVKSPFELNDFLKGF